MTRNLVSEMIMRQSSLRALLLALTMVFQTIVAGAGVARAAPDGYGTAVSAHCVKSAASAGDATDRGRESRRHMCDACSLCAGPPAAAFVGFAPLVISPRASQVAGFQFIATSGVPTRLAYARFARGPPRPL
jgi:hypothetical protein